MKDRYINPFTDFGFKRLFGSEPNKDLLLDFLNELIKERGRIQTLTYLKAEQLGPSAFERRAVFDLYCESETGEKFIVEMQKAKQMKTAGEPVAKIVAYTGRTAEQIRAL